MAWASNDGLGCRLVLGYLFLFFFGVFGIHRLYLGRVFTGVLWMFTGGLFGLGLLFDIFAVPYMAATVE